MLVAKIIGSCFEQGGGSSLFIAVYNGFSCFFVMIVMPFLFFFIFPTFLSLSEKHEEKTPFSKILDGSKD